MLWLKRHVLVTINAARDFPNCHHKDQFFYHHKQDWELSHFSLQPARCLALRNVEMQSQTGVTGLEPSNADFGLLVWTFETGKCEKH